MKQQQSTIYKIWFLGSLMLFGYASAVFGQMGLGINTVTPKSTLDVMSTSVNSANPEGIQGPRLTLAELTAKGNSMYGTDQTGAIIYVTAVSGGGNTGQRANITASGYYYFDGSLWQKMNLSESFFSAGDIVQSFRPADFDGWYILDGRAITSLPAKARAAATALGFATSLPDARDRVLKNKSASESLAATGGTASVVLSQANLPNVSLSGSATGTLASAGAHTHTAAATLGSAGAHTHAAAGSLAAGGGHTHTASGNLAAAGGHTHGVSGTLNSAGNHSHQFGLTVFVMPAGTTDVDRGYNAGSAWNYTTRSTYTTGSAGNHNHTLSSTLAAGGGHTHAVSGNLASNGAHAHSVAATLAASDAHTHGITATLASANAHTHTASGTVALPVNGTATAVNNRSAYLVVNTFIYLGL